MSSPLPKKTATQAMPGKFYGTRIIAFRSHKRIKLAGLRSLIELRRSSLATKASNSEPKRIACGSSRVGSLAYHEPLSNKE